MPRPILGLTPTTGAPLLKPVESPSAGTTLSGPKLMQRLRERRSAKYLEAVKRLDAGTHLHDQAALEAVLAAIAAEFPDLSTEQLPLGLVSRCYLGPPYEVHRCDLAGNIIEHFETWRPMPGAFEPARGLALHSAYLFIEVYTDSLRAIVIDGTVATMPVGR